MSNESTMKTIVVVLGVCLVCSVLVSAAAVTLKSFQEKNRQQEKLKNILEAGGLLKEGLDLRKTYRDKIRAEVIDLSTGLPVPDDQEKDPVDPETFDIKETANDPELSRTIPGNEDLAQINRMPVVMVIYKVMDGNRVEKLILPVYGKGLWSTMYGFIAMDRDLRTVRGFTFYEHGETPGLGGEVDNPRWKQLWVGKEAFDFEGNVKIHVIKGKAGPEDPEAAHQIDGLSGSTLTTRGVDNLVRFWLGDWGYGRYIQKLRDYGVDT